jgi:hypothetical protein
MPYCISEKNLCTVQISMGIYNNNNIRRGGQIEIKYLAKLSHALMAW